MSDNAQPFPFSQFVPGFDFLANLANVRAGASDAKAGGLGGMPGLSNWVAPTLSVEEVDKRIKELKTVQFWLEQNLHALKATVQALEVQKMTLSTLQGMNLRMDDLAKAFAMPGASAGAAATASAEASPTAKPAPDGPSASTSAPRGGADEAADGTAAKGLIDPLQWWGALSQQFQQIANTALQEAAHLKMAGGGAGSGSTSGAAGKPAAKSAGRSANRAKSANSTKSALGDVPAPRQPSTKRAPARKPATRRRSPPNTER